jgi:hypothetical protein
MDERHSKKEILERVEKALEEGSCMILVASKFDEGIIENLFFAEDVPNKKCIMVLIKNIKCLMMQDEEKEKPLSIEELRNLTNRIASKDKNFPKELFENVLSSMENLEKNKPTNTKELRASLEKTCKNLEEIEKKLFD